MCPLFTLVFLLTTLVARSDIVRITWDYPTLEAQAIRSWNIYADFSWKPELNETNIVAVPFDTCYVTNIDIANTLLTFTTGATNSYRYTLDAPSRFTFFWITAVDEHGLESELSNMAWSSEEFRCRIRGIRQ
jgi:hypothetical protein